MGYANNVTDTLWADVSEFQPPVDDSYLQAGYQVLSIRANDGTYVIAEQEVGDEPAYVCVRDQNGAVLARLESRHVHGVGVDSRGDIYAGLTVDHSVDKFVRVR